jgi:hypothetical protein
MLQIANHPRDRGWFAIRDSVIIFILFYFGEKRLSGGVPVEMRSCFRARVPQQPAPLGGSPESGISR